MPHTLIAVSHCEKSSSAGFSGHIHSVVGRLLDVYTVVIHTRTKYMCIRTGVESVPRQFQFHFQPQQWRTSCGTHNNGISLYRELLQLLYTLIKHTSIQSIYGISS